MVQSGSTFILRNNDKLRIMATYKRKRFFMKRQILQKDFESKKKCQIRRKTAMSIVILILFLGFLYFLYFSYSKRVINQEFEEYLGNILVSEKIPEEEIETIKSYLEEMKLSAYNKGMATKVLSTIYSMKNQTEDSISYMCQSLFYFEQENETLATVQMSISLARTLIHITAYDMAEEVLEETLEIPLQSDEEISAHIQIYTKLAEAMVGQRNYEQALEMVELAEYKLEELEGYEEYVHSLKVSKAKACFGLGEYKTASELLETIDSTKLEADFQTSADYVIPYYDIMGLSLLQKGNIEEAFMYFDRFLDYCDKYSYNLIRLNYVNEFVLTALQFGYADHERIKQYGEEMVEYYRQELKATNEMFANIMLEAYNISMRNVAIEHERMMRRFRIFGGVLLTVCILIIIVLVLFYYYRRTQVDFLTGAYNRMKLRTVTRALHERSQPFYIIMFDIDNFKRCNDVYGHAFGDKVLVHISKKVMQILPKMSMFFRYGGEEFVVLCEMNSEEEVRAFAEKMRASVEKLEWETGEQVTISVGVAYSETAKDPFLTADECLYMSKKTGKNRVTYQL